jgi:hypothetical protein
MKTICLLLLTMINVRLVNGVLYAAPANPAQNQTASEGMPKAVNAQTNRPTGDGAPQSDTKATGETPEPRRAAKSRPSIKGVANNSTRPGQVAGRQTLAAAGNPANFRPTSAAQPDTTQVRGSAQNEAIYRALPVRPGAAIRPGSPLAGTVRHRDPNAAVIGGAAHSNIRSTAAIDGTRTNLKRPRN